MLLRQRPASCCCCWPPRVLALRMKTVLLSANTHAASQRRQKGRGVAGLPLHPEEVDRKLRPEWGIVPAGHQRQANQEIGSFSPLSITTDMELQDGTSISRRHIVVGFHIGRLQGCSSCTKVPLPLWSWKTARASADRQMVAPRSRTPPSRRPAPAPAPGGM